MAMPSVHICSWVRQMRTQSIGRVVETKRTHPHSMTTSRLRLDLNVHSAPKFVEIPLPSPLKRFVFTPSTRSSNLPQLKTVLRLKEEDFENVILHGNSIVVKSSQSKCFTKHNFDNIFAPDATQQEMYSVCLPDLLQCVFSGYDSCFIYFGAANKVRNETLYSCTEDSQSGLSTYPGIFPASLLLTFRLISELRSKCSNFRYSVRISAIYYSQSTDRICDLLAHFGNVSSETVEISEDSALGVKIENLSEIRVGNAEQALFYFKQAIRVRETGNDVEQRCGHFFFYLNLYRYKKDGGQLLGGRSRLCLVDLGSGEKNSKGDSRALTMPIITNILVALFQGQRHLPSRKNALCLLLKDCLSRIQSKLLLTTLSDRVPETDNILQMMGKVQRAVRPRKILKIGSDTSSDSKRRIVSENDWNSSSEQSCAETVIFLGPSIKVDTSSKTNGKAKNVIVNSEKRQMILDWIDNSKRGADKINACIQCNEEDIDNEIMIRYPNQRELHDIFEDDEENSPSRESGNFIASTNSNSMIESCCSDKTGGINHPSILSLEKGSNSTPTKGSSSNSVEDDDLERAMAASISSIRSHEILSRLNEIPSSENSPSCKDSLNVCRKAIHLEKCAAEKLLQMKEIEKKKKKKLSSLNCCETAMVSSGSSTSFSSKIIPDFDYSQKFNADISDPSQIVVNFVPQLSSMTLNDKKALGRTEVQKSRLPKKCLDLSSVKVLSQRSHANPSTSYVKVHSKESGDSKREKRGKRINERRNSVGCETTRDNEKLTVTKGQNDSGTYSSGHGSDENGSVYVRPCLRLFSNNRTRNRESFSASSGYESASGDSKNNHAVSSRKKFLDVKRGRPAEQSSFAVFDRRIKSLILRQKLLREEFKDSRRLLGVHDEPFISASSSSLQGSTLLEALSQETKILEKRLIACRNHVSIVTCFL